MSTYYDDHLDPIRESRLDWITVTCKPGDRQDVLRHSVQRWTEARRAEGFDVTPFRTPNYQGVRVDGLAFGSRDADCMVSASGGLAQQHGAQLITWADNVSRLDAQLTVQESDLSLNWARHIDLAAGSHPLVTSEKIGTRLLTQRPRGITSYIGSPAGDRMLRAYDKHAEQPESYPPGSWRFEVQWRHKRAAYVASRLLDQSCGPQSCLAAVCNAYQDYGVSLPVDCIPRGWRDVSIRAKPDDERRLEWIKSSVAPCVERLTNHLGMDKVLEALGLASLTDTLDSQRRTLEKIERFGLPEAYSQIPLIPTEPEAI